MTADLVLGAFLSGFLIHTFCWWLATVAPNSIGRR
jgi:hypothetical protein